MMRFFKRLPVRNQLLMIALLMLAGVFAVMLLSYYKITGIIIERNNSYMLDTMAQAEKSVAKNCDSLDRIVNSIAINSSVQDYLSTADPPQQYELSKNLERLMISMIQLKDGILGTSVVGKSGNEYSFNWDGSVIDSVKPALEKTNHIYYSGVESRMRAATTYQVFVVGSNIYAIDSGKGPLYKIGTAALVVDSVSLGPEVKLLSNTPGTRFFLLDRNSQVFSSNDAAAVGKPFLLVDLNEYPSAAGTTIMIDGKRNKLFVGDLPEVGGKIVGLADESIVLGSLTEIQSWAVRILFIVLLLLFIPFFLIMNNITKPLVKLTGYIRQIKAGNHKFPEKKVELEGYAEVTYLADEFNDMLSEINNLTRTLVESNSQLYEIELLKKQSELELLRSQINPHFLYNTLESIKSIANLKGVTEVKDMAMSLASILRYSLKGQAVVPLSKEIEIVQYYIEIQQIRFKNRFVVAYEIPDELMNAAVLRMMLQPVVENALYHGLEPKPGKGSLTIGGREEGGDIVLWIHDDGVGIQPDTLARLQEDMSAGARVFGKPTSGERGVGIVNVHSRLALTFGEGYGLTVKSAPDCGTEVTIRIPARRDTNV